MNSAGFFTINSQPSVNGAASDDPVHGWGGPKGFVYQKAYLEFFTSPANLAQLKSLLAKFPSIDYQAINAKGEQFGTLYGIAAVTWGVWPSSEIKQPTVVDPNVFCNIWKDEAFALWRSQWMPLYEKDSESHKVLSHIADTYFLVTIIENNFIGGDIFAIFNEIIGPTSTAQ